MQLYYYAIARYTNTEEGIKDVLTVLSGDIERDDLPPSLEDVVQEHSKQGMRVIYISALDPTNPIHRVLQRHIDEQNDQKTSSKHIFFQKTMYDTYLLGREHQKNGSRPLRKRNAGNLLKHAGYDEGIQKDPSLQPLVEFYWEFYQLGRIHEMEGK